MLTRTQLSTGSYEESFHSGNRNPDEDRGYREHREDRVVAPTVSSTTGGVRRGLNSHSDLQKRSVYGIMGRVNVISLICTFVGIGFTMYLFLAIDQTYRGEGLIDNYKLLILIGTVCGLVLVHSQKVIVTACYNWLLVRGKITLGLLIDLQSVITELPIMSICHSQPLAMVILAFMILVVVGAVPGSIALVQSFSDVYGVTTTNITENVRLWEIGGCDPDGCYYQSMGLLAKLNEVKDPDDFLDAKVDIISLNRDVVKLMVFTPLWDDASVETVKGKSTFNKTVSRITRGYGIRANVSAWRYDGRSERVISNLEPLPQIAKSVMMNTSVEIYAEDIGLIGLDIEAVDRSRSHHISIDIKLECVSADYNLTATLGNIEINDLTEVEHYDCEWDEQADKMMDQLSGTLQVTTNAQMIRLIAEAVDGSKALAQLAARYTSVFLHRLSTGEAEITEVPADSVIKRTAITDAIKFNYLMRWLSLSITVASLVATLASIFVPTILSTCREQNLAVFDGTGLFYDKCAPPNYIELHSSPHRCLDNSRNRELKVQLTVIGIDEKDDENDGFVHYDNLTIQVANGYNEQRLVCDSYLAGKMKREYKRQDNIP